MHFCFALHAADGPATLLHLQQHVVWKSRDLRFIACQSLKDSAPEADPPLDSDHPDPVHVITASTCCSADLVAAVEALLVQVTSDHYTQKLAFEIHRTTFVSLSGKCTEKTMYEWGAVSLRRLAATYWQKANLHMVTVSTVPCVQVLQELLKVPVECYLTCPGPVPLFSGNLATLARPASVAAQCLSECGITVLQVMVPLLLSGTNIAVCTVGL